MPRKYVSALGSGPPCSQVGHFCVNCAAPLVTKVIEGREVEACPNDSFILWHDPKVATAVVVEVRGGVVLGRRAIEPGYGLWCLPGGFVNDNEDPAAAAARECMEEIGAPVEMTGLIGVYHIAKTTAPSMVGIAYRARITDDATPSAGSEMLEVAVFPPNAMPPLAFPSHQTVLAEYLKSLGSQEESVTARGGAAARLASQPSRRPARQQRPRTR